jgi:hypothetical protein
MKGIAVMRHTTNLRWRLRVAWMAFQGQPLLYRVSVVGVESVRDLTLIDCRLEMRSPGASLTPNLDTSGPAVVFPVSPPPASAEVVAHG